MARVDGSKRAVRVAILFVLCALAFALRVAPAFDVVFPAPEAVRLLGVDPYYHLRHAEYAAKHFPELQRWDVGTHFPNGQRSDAAGLFDLLIAGSALTVGGGSADDRLVERVAAWIPPVLGSAAIVLLYWLARAVLPVRWALLACGIFLVYPGAALPRSMLGFSDHHVAEIVLALAVVGGWTRYFGPTAPERAIVEWRRCCAAALPLVLFLFTWSGAPIFVLMAGIVIFSLLSLDVAKGRSPLVTVSRSLRYGLAASVGFVLGLAWLPDLLMHAGILPALALAAAGITIAIPAYGLALHALATRLGRPQAVSLLGVLCVAALGAMAVARIPFVTHLASQLWSTKTPLLMEHTPVDGARLWGALGVAAVLAILAIPLSVVAAWRRPAARAALVPVLAGSMLLALWWQSSDYGYAVPTFVAVMAALALYEGLRSIATLRAERPGGVLIAALLIVLVVPVWPLGWVANRPWASAAEISAMPRISEAWMSALEWMRVHTPTPSLPIDARVPGWNGDGFHYPADTYGVVVPWEYGNFVSLLARRVPVWSRWPSQANAAWFLSQDEEESLQRLCTECEDSESVRYAIVDSLTLADLFPAKLATAEQPAFLYQGVEGVWEIDGESVPHWTYGSRYRHAIGVRLYLGDGDGLAHYRIVYETSQQSYSSYVIGDTWVARRTTAIDGPETRVRLEARIAAGDPSKAPEGLVYDGVIASSVKIFERVAGASLVGRAPPGASVEAELLLSSAPTGREFAYHRTCVVGDDGEFELVVPHSTDRAGAAITSEGAYLLRLRDPTGRIHATYAPVEVDESAVQRGLRIDLGSPF